MYWELLYWGTYLSTSVPIWIVAEDLSFNWYWLQNSSILTEFFNPFESWSIEYNTFDIPQDHWKGFLSKFWREKTILIKWIIKENTQTALENRIDDIKKNLRINEWNLKYKMWDWSYRQITASVVDMRFDKQFYNISWMPFEFEFKANEPFWYNINNEQKLYENVSASPFLEEITLDWNEISKPQVFLTFSSATSVTSISININNRTLTWTWTISAWDYLSIDCLNKIVQKNWTNQDYTWTFPNLIPWVNPITFTIDGTFTCDISAIYRLNYI